MAMGKNISRGCMGAESAPETRLDVSANQEAAHEDNKQGGVQQEIRHSRDIQQLFCQCQPRLARHEEATDLRLRSGLQDDGASIGELWQVGHEAVRSAPNV